MTKSLTERLDKVVAFDAAESQRRYEKAWGHTQRPINHSYFSKGVKSENARLAPLWPAVKEAIEGLESLRSDLCWLADRYDNSIIVDNALGTVVKQLASLEKAIAEVEGKT